ncbi:hypothetical protein FOZ60_016504 [Perkinsus olseni]|uniref:Uncharacterized protein n=1 Tax=Perkinsus olseni TaxID=32597 RepID=A0A7J6N4C5_PEROL|nr:hypothetical protein FOZ60_016504 [Perkinsus olseni]
MVATGDAFEVLHESDPAKDAGPVIDVTKPSGIYRAEDGGLSMTMEFKQVAGNDRVHYHIKFTSDYTATVAGVMGDGRHFIARDALYDIHDNVVSVNVVNSDLYTILRRIDWFGLETLKFTYSSVDNCLFLAERGQNAQLFQLLGCAAPIENYSDGKLVVVVDDDGEEDPKLDFPSAVMQSVQDVIDFIFGKD